MRKKEYALYKGDEFIDIGTVEELAEKLNTTVKTIRWYAGSRKWRDKNGRKNRIIIIPIED